MPRKKDGRSRKEFVSQRKRLPNDRESLTHKFTIYTNEGELDGYLTVGFYEDGSPGEIFIRVAKIGSLVQGLLSIIAMSVSVSLQHGVPLQVFVDKYTHQKFEPCGMTSNPEIPFAKSLPDYIFQWLGQKFCGLPPRRQIDESMQMETTTFPDIGNQ